jgi:DNA-3-methyladenine glycosylase
MKTRSAEPGGASGAATPLGGAFYERPVLDVAAELIGCTVVHGSTSGMIVETEAYHQQEPACHAYVGLTPRTRTLFGPPGRAYVYRSYGIHALLNAVCEPEGVGAAVLIRALRPLEGIELMRERRGAAGTSAERELCSGPGRLTQALGIELSENGTSLESGPVLITPRQGAAPEIAVSARIGITKAAELPWRFSLAGDRNVSRPWPWRAARRAARREAASRSG